MTEATLSDLRVIELAQGIAGPYAGKLFADLGAEVIKIEPPAGDSARRLGPFPGDDPHPEKSGLYLHLNTNKKSVTIDVDVTSGQLLLKKLLAKADVLIESDGPDRMAARGLAFDDVRGEHPNLVYVSITPFGGSGPYRGYSGNSLTAMAFSTLMYSTGDPDREPLTTGGTPGEYIGGIHGWIGALAALAYREREGRGQHVDVSLAEAVACADEYNSSMYAFQGAIRRRYYSRHIFGYPMDIMACKDGHLVLIPGAAGLPRPGAGEDAPPSPMALLTENMELDKDPAIASLGERMINWQAVDELLEPWLKEHTAKEIVDTAQALRMPFALVPDVKELLEGEHLAARGFFQRIDHPEAGELAYAGPPFRMDGAPAGRAPLLGEHNEETLSELGYSKEEQSVLREREVT